MMPDHTPEGRTLMKQRRMVLTLLILAGCGPRDAGNAEVPATHALLSEGGCQSCRIVAETLAVLGDASDTVQINEGATPAADSRGRFYVLERGGGSVLVFSPEGEMLTTFGRAGNGPGEFSNIAEIHVAPGDTIVLIGNGVLHVVGPDYRHVRQHALRAGGGAEFFNTMLADGRILRMSGHNEFLLVDMNAAVSRPVMLKDVDSVDCNDCGERTFREGITAGTVWSGQQNRYRIEQHSLAGELISGFVRRTHWFSDWLPPTQGENFDMITEFSRPRFFGVRQSQDSLLWAHVLLIDDPSRIPTLSGAMEMEGASGEFTPAARKMMADVLSNFVTMVEVIDPATRQVLASRELKMIVVPMKRDMVAQMRLDEYGDWSCVVMRLRLEGREAGRE